jgi:hypothetical protein
MGASTFTDMSFGKTVEEAFQNAKDDARQYRGHQEGYSGDIQTKHSFRIIEIGRKDRKTVVNELLESGEISEKDGPAGAIILKGEDAKKFRECTGKVGKKGVVVLFFGWARS